METIMIGILREFFGVGGYQREPEGYFSWQHLTFVTILVVIMIINFYKINKVAGLIQIPYLLWLLFAAYLNLTIFILNR